MCDRGGGGGGGTEKGGSDYRGMQEAGYAQKTTQVSPACVDQTSWSTG